MLWPGRESIRLFLPIRSHRPKSPPFGSILSDLGNSPSHRQSIILCSPVNCKPQSESRKIGTLFAYLKQMNITIAENEGLLTSISLRPRFHPIYLVRERRIIGFEGLARGFAGISPEEIGAEELFRRAEQEGIATELDRNCREKAISGFASLEVLPDTLLFLNVSAETIDAGIGEYQHLDRELNRTGLAPDQIVLEIVESRIKAIDALIFFVHYYRSKGFLIALDDVGAGHSNLERISLLKPDIIKIDRSLISEIGSGYHKQEVCKALILLAQRIGALTVAEGIETEKEALTCLELGADMLQGFFFARPLEAEACNRLDDAAIIALAQKFGSDSLARKEHQMQLAESHRDLVKRLCNRLSRKNQAEYVRILASSLRSTRYARCAYVLDPLGRQITPTVIQKGFRKKQHRLFAPTPAGTDHSLKSYFLRREKLHSCYISEPYISKATGNLCITASQGFVDAGGREFLLCIDIEQRGREDL